MHLQLPDPDPGRCPNYRTDSQGKGQRCLRRSDNHVNKECVFDEPLPPRQTEVHSYIQASKPKPWVEPEILT